jgi:hypothetical protein
MKRVSFHDSLVEATHLKNLLEQAGIRCTIKNAQLSGALGEIPFLECSPEVWVLEDRQLKAAELVLRDLRAPPPVHPAWRCTHCGERNEGQFAACWHCGEADTER